MTCCVGIKYKGDVYLGGDAAASKGDLILKYKDPKVFKVGIFGIAYTTSYRMADILQYSLIPPVWNPKKISLEKYMRTSFINAIRKAFLENGFGTLAGNTGGEKDDIILGDEGGEFLVGVAGRLFIVAADYAIGECFLDYASVGSGSSYALGSLHSTVGSGRIRLLKALEAASEYNSGVRPPFTILKIEK